MGSVGRIYVKQDPAWGDDQGLMAVERLTIRKLTRTQNGWVIVAGDNREHVFEVDADGESPDCVPWDSELEQQFRKQGGDIPPSHEPPEPPAPNPYQAAAKAASGIIGRDVQEARRRESEASDVEAPTNMWQRGAALARAAVLADAEAERQAQEAADEARTAALAEGETLTARVFRLGADDAAARVHRQRRDMQTAGAAERAADGDAKARAKADTEARQEVEQ